MNKLLLVLALFTAFVSNSQSMESVFSENFDSNNNGWSTGGNSFQLTNGIILMKSSRSKDQFNFPSKPNKIEAGHSAYVITTDLSIENLTEGARVGIAIANVVDKTTMEMLSGYVFYIELYKGKYFLTCHNIDDKTPRDVTGFEALPLGRYGELKISVNNTNGSCEVFINNERAYDLEGPMFNINNIGLYTKGTGVSKCSSLTVEQSKTLNKKFAYDLIDSQYDESLKTNRIYRGRHDFDVLLDYVPKILLCDNLFVILAKESEFTFDDLISELLDDMDCKIEKSSYSDPSTPNLKYYKLQYKEVSFVVSYNKDTKYIVSNSVIFESTKDAETFFDEYARVKMFSNQRTDNEARYASHPLMTFSFVSQSDNMVNFLY